MAAASYKTEAALQAAIIAAMATAIANNAFTCSVAVNTNSTQDVNRVMNMLSDSNFGATVTGNNLVITW
jgi:hypothetical protein